MYFALSVLTVPSKDPSHFESRFEKQNQNTNFRDVFCFSVLTVPSKDRRSAILFYARVWVFERALARGSQLSSFTIVVSAAERRRAESERVKNSVHTALSSFVYRVSFKPI